MNVSQVIFLLVAAVTLASAFLVVTSRSIVHAALWLVLALFGVGVTYVLLSAGFFAVAQVIIYIGAIAILFIFAVMLTRQIMRDTGPQVNRNWWLAALVAVVLFAAILVMLRSWGGSSAMPGPFPEGLNSLAMLGQALVAPDGYLLPFELASVLLVAAMIGAIYVSLAKK